MFKISGSHNGYLDLILELGFVGLLLGAAGIVTLVAHVTAGAERGLTLPVLVYAFGLMAMLGCSAAYNLATHPGRRAVLRRLDHAMIFVMIAGTYTPFTMRLPDGTAPVTLTGLVWAVALTGAVVKLVVPHRFERPESFGRSLIFVGLSEGIAIYGLLISFLVLPR